MDAVLRTSDGLHIVRSSRSPAVAKIALQISRNFHQYFGADTEIIDSPTSYTPAYSNVVRVATGIDLSDSFIHHFPIEVISHNVITVRGDDGLTTKYNSPGLGAIFLRPLKYEQVELVVWGADEEGLEIAARLVPMLTGVGQPDFVVADRRMLWGGAGEVLAMGHFDHLWNVTRGSFLI